MEAAGIAHVALFMQHIVHNAVMPCHLGMRRKCVGKTRRSASLSQAGID